MGLLHPNPASSRTVVGLLVGITAVTLVGAGVRLSTWHSAPEQRPAMPVVLQPAAVAVEEVVVTAPPVIVELPTIDAGSSKTAASPAPAAGSSLAGAQPAAGSGQTTAPTPTPSPTTPEPTSPVPTLPTSPTPTPTPTPTLPPSPTDPGTVLAPVTDAVSTVTSGLGQVLSTTTTTLLGG